MGLDGGALGVDELVVADEAEAWAGAGFAVDPDGNCRVSGVRVRLVGREHGWGIVGWSLRGLSPRDGQLDGVPTTRSEQGAATPSTHPNGVVAIDHVVLLSPDVTRTVEAFAELGLEPRREREGELGGRAIRQVFFRLGEVIVEVVGSPETAAEGPASLWGITYVVGDIEASVAYLGEHAGRVKDAVQPGRRITTLRHRELGLSVRTALISQ